MPDPPKYHTADDNVTHVEAPSGREYTSPAIPISGLHHGGPLGAANQEQVRRDKEGASAYATNQYAGIEFGVYDFDAGHASQVPQRIESSYPASISGHTGSLSSKGPASGTFGSQEWDPPVTKPYLEFTREIVYEPTGELANEQVSTFDQFDSPPLLQRPADASQTSTSQGPGGLFRKPFSPESGNNANFAPPPPRKSALKRRADQAPDSVGPGEGSRSQSTDFVPPPARTVSFGRMSNPSQSPTGEGLISPGNTTEQTSGRPGPGANTRMRSQRAADPQSPGRAWVKSPPGAPQSGGKSSGIVYKGKASSASILPPEKVFPIQIGSDLFRLSGASISSDAPSYFTQFFEDQVRQNEENGGVRTLYIDRDPVTFRDVARHLQGYHVKPTNGSHFVRLFADAQFYSLPRLIDQLFESEIFIQIGDRHFQIPKDIFSNPGDSPNFFSLGFAVFFSTPGEVFPGLDRKGLLRPPSIVPPCVPGRSAEVFAELIHMLRGYPLHIRNQEHRAELLRDCRYFHLRGLEQKLIAHEISYNLERQRSEICLRLEDVKPSGVSFVSDVRHGDAATSGGWVNYARPFVDDDSCEMILEIGGESTVIDLTDMRADFHGLTKARVSSLFQVIANKMNLPVNAPLGLMMLSGGQAAQPASPGHTPLSEDRVKVRIEGTAEVILDGEPYEVDWAGLQARMRARTASSASEQNTDSEAMSEAMSPHGLSRTTSNVGAGQQSQPQRKSSHTSDTGYVQGQSRLGVPPLQTSRLPGGAPLPKKRKRQGSMDNPADWIVRTGQWRLRVQPNPQDMIRGGLEIVFVAVKLDVYSEEKARNSKRSFLS